MKQYLGIDIGGTAVKLGIVDEAGAVLAKAEESVSFDGYQTPILTTVLKAAQTFLADRNIPAGNAGPCGHRRFRHRADRQPQGHRGRVPAATCPTTSAPHQGRAGKDLRPAGHGRQRRQLHDAGRSVGRRRKGLYGRHRRDAGHRRGRRHPDRRPSAGRCAGSGRRAGPLPHPRAGRRGLHLRRKGLLGALRRHHRSGARRAGDPAWKDGRAIFAAAEAGDKTVLALLDAGRTRSRRALRAWCISSTRS